MDSRGIFEFSDGLYSIYLVRSLNDPEIQYYIRFPIEDKNLEKIRKVNLNRISQESNVKMKDLILFRESNPDRLQAYLDVLRTKQINYVKQIYLN